jgi:tRNA uridine 5-carbamoylmethylation protein Kti12
MVWAGDYVFDERLEPAIRAATDAAIESFIEDGFDVIIDETHVSQARRRDIIEHVDGRAYVIAVVFPDLGPLNLERRMNDSRGYSREKWAEVIDKMRAAYQPPDKSEGFWDIIYL